MPRDLLAATGPRDLLAGVAPAGPPQVPDAFPRDAAPAGTPAPAGAPSAIDRVQTNPAIGAPLQTLLQGGQGAEQLLAHGAASISDLGGATPNSLSAMLHAIADHVDVATKAQRKGYEESGARVDAASTDPRLSGALRRTGEAMGNMLNPAGMSGNAIEAAPGVLNAATRGAASGAGFAATQPVDTGNYWTEKAKQVGVGGLAGAVTGAAAEKLGQAKSSDGPKASTFKELASDSYDASKATGATVPRSDFENAINGAEADARKNVTYRPSLQPKAATAIAQIKEDIAAAGDNVTFEDMDVARRIARTVLTSPDKNERAVAHSIIDGIDGYVASLNAPEGDALSTARDLFQRGSKLDTIERLVTKAQDSIGAGQTRTKLDNALRQQFRGLKNNDRAFSQFSPQEQDAIKQIVRGTVPQNIARWVGKASPTTSIPIVGELLAVGSALASGSATEAALAVGTAGAGAIGQHIADRTGEANVNSLKNLVAGRNSALPGPTPDIPVWNNPLATYAAQSVLQPRGQ